jgi:hypothetical protein
MRAGVDVLLATDSLASLQPPPTSIVDGRPAMCVKRVCCLRAAGASRFAVNLPVDEATARRFARTCRLATMWRRRVVPSVLAMAALGLVPAVIGVVSHNLFLLLLSGLVQLCLATLILVGRLALALQRSQHHPVLVGREHVAIRGIDRATAYTWASLNPAGAIDILG